MKPIARIVTFIMTLALLMIPLSACAEEAGAVKPFRAVWVSTVYNLDYPSRQGLSADQLRQETDTILDNIKDMGMTAVILQVRPAADALYPSELFPWSKYISGTQGTAPDGGFDPLGYWVGAAHDRGLELHAWINPYRITTGKEAEWQTVVSSHPAKQHPEWVMTGSDGNYYFNPGVPEARQLITRGAMEIVNKYEVDGLHMDDYFYPAGPDDSAQYEQFGNGRQIDDWRRNNVDTQVYDLNAAIKGAKPEVSFGISPFGIWANKSTMADGSDTRGNESYTAHFADTRKWVKEGWLDYICPQLYWNIGFEVADYKILANWWADVVRGTDVALYIGMADYKVGDTDQTSAWQDGIGAIKDQIALNRTIPEITGEAHFEYKSIAGNGDLWGFYKEVYASASSEEPQPTETPTPEPVPSEAPPEPTQPPKQLRPMQGGHEAYMQGGDGMFRPEAPLTRAETSAMLARLAVNEAGEKLYNEEAQAADAPFSDVEQDAWYAKPIAFLQKYRILNGYEDGTFQPMKPVSRAEFVALACRLAGIAADGTDSGFQDVSWDHWAAASIGYAAKQGWVSGYDGAFRPDREVSRAEAVKIMNRVLGREVASGTAELPFTDVAKDHWAYDEIAEATGYGTN